MRLLLAHRRTLVVAAVQKLVDRRAGRLCFGTFGEGQERVTAENALLCLLRPERDLAAAASRPLGDCRRLACQREHDVESFHRSLRRGKVLVYGMLSALRLAVVYMSCCHGGERPGNRLEQFLLLTIGAMAGTAIGLLIPRCPTRDGAPRSFRWPSCRQLLLAGVLVPRLPRPADCRDRRQRLLAHRSDGAACRSR